MVLSDGKFWLIVAGLSSFKLLFLPSYFSTDFEVHRNWLALTYSLPLSQWYTEATSQWTLDYPPLFAWFEYVLAHVAQWFDPAMLKVSNLNYASELTVLFQRLSVIATDVLLAYAANGCSKEMAKKCGEGLSQPIFLLIVTNSGLLLVDHIHFQYNGFLFGFLFLTFWRLVQGRNVEATLWFSVLVCMKHIYLYMAPALLVYMLRSHCLQLDPRSGAMRVVASITAVATLAAPALAVLFITFAPFAVTGQIANVFARLFPFKRGLSHAYWAPNFWALYNAADKVLAILGRRTGMWVPRNVTSSSLGLVQEFEHSVLPSITPGVTFILTVLAMLPALVWVWRSPHKPWVGVRAAVLCGFVSFMFGWHVHEKAILMVILPLSLFVAQEQFEARAFLLTAIVGHFSLLPLIFTKAEAPIKILLWLGHTLLCWLLLSLHWYPADHYRLFHKGLPNVPLTSTPQTLYLLGLFPLLLLQSFPPPAYPFLPLLLTSVYCSLGLLSTLLSYYYRLLTLPQHCLRVL